MIANGLESEVYSLMPHRQLPALQTVGYQEFFDYFAGKTNYATTIEKIKQHTRNYAKRQMTWFKNQQSYHKLTSRSWVDEILIDLK
jgi:tRNA delta(2)-isopentenylpyrophosphate transferase